MGETKLDRVVEELLGEVAARDGVPAVLEATWDGDTQGWFLDLALICRLGDGDGESRYRRHYLRSLRFGGDIRLFSGEVPPWPEVRVARRLWERLRAARDVELWLPAEEPDDDCPGWLERHQAIACRVCGKPILPRVSPHVPTDVCHPCTHERARQARVQIDYEAGDRNRALFFTSLRGSEIVEQAKVDEIGDLGLHLGGRELFRFKDRIGCARSSYTCVTLAREHVAYLLERLTPRLHGLVAYRDPPPDAGQERGGVIRRRRPFTIGDAPVVLDLNDEHDQWIARLHRLIELLRRADDELRVVLVGNEGITPRHMAIMRPLKRADGHRLALAELAKKLLPELGGEADLHRSLDALAGGECVAARDGHVELLLRGRLVPMSED